MSDDPESKSARGGSASSSSAARSKVASRGASASADPAKPKSAESSRKQSAGLASPSGKKGSGKKGSANSKSKKKKKPIVEDPKFVRDLISHVESNDLDWVRNFLSSPEYIGKFDFAQTAGEALVMGALKNHAELVSILIESGASPNLASGKALQRAAFQGALEAAEVLVRAGADVNGPSIFAEYVPLHYSAQVGSTSLVKFLLSAGAQADLACHPEQCGTFNGWVALHFAADAGHLEVVHILLEAGAIVDTPNANGDTALAIAAERGQWDVVRWLVAAGADIHATRRGLNVVQWAIYRGDQDAVQFLVSYGARPELDVRALWFPAAPAAASAAAAAVGTPGLTLKEVIYKQFSEDIYDQIDLAIYRGGKQAMEREAKKKIINSVQWESSPVFDPYAFDTTPQVQIRSFPPHIVAMISSYEM